MRVDEQNLVESLRVIGRESEYSETPLELEGIRAEDLAEALLRLEFEEQLGVLNRLDPEMAGNVLVELPSQTAKDLLREIPDEATAHYLDILPVDDALELVDVLGSERLHDLLQVIPEQDAHEIRLHLAYPEGSAGQLMSRDYLTVGPEATMDDVLSVIRSAPDQVETVNYLYVLSEHHHLLGVLTLRRVLRAPAQTEAKEVMNEDVMSAHVRDDQESASRLMARYGFAALPVLDDRGRMVGIITADDAQEVVSEADTEDVLALGAVTGNAEAYLSLRTWQLIGRRLPWLLILFVAETFTGSVLRHYVPDEQSGIGEIARLTVFIPLLIGAGGNSGSQVTSTITRSLAIGELRTSDYMRVLRRELVTASIMGLALGFVAYLRARFGWNSGADISLVVGLSLVAIILWATTVSSVLPLAAKRLGIDPAVMSAPFITTFVDATGLIIYFEIAGQVLHLAFPPWLR